MCQERNCQIKEALNHIQSTFVGHRLGTHFSDCELEIGVVETESKNELKRKVEAIETDVSQRENKQRRMD